MRHMVHTWHGANRFAVPQRLCAESQQPGGGPRQAARIFLKEQNQLITGKRKLEEKCESSQKNNLKLTASQDALLLDNGSLSNELKLRMKNIDVTQATTSQLRTEKKELKTKLQ